MKYSRKVRKKKNKRKNKKTKKRGGSRKYVNRSYFSFKKNGVPRQYKENFTRYKNIIEKVGLLVDRKPYELWKYYLSKIQFHKLPKIPEEIFKLPAPLRSTASRYWNRNKKIYSKYQNNAPTPVASRWTGVVPRMLGIENEKRMPLGYYDNNTGDWIPVSGPVTYDTTGRTALNNVFRRAEMRGLNSKQQQERE